MQASSASEGANCTSKDGDCWLIGCYIFARRWQQIAISNYCATVRPLKTQYFAFGPTSACVALRRQFTNFDTVPACVFVLRVDLAQCRESSSNSGAAQGVRNAAYVFVKPTRWNWQLSVLGASICLLS